MIQKVEENTTGSPPAPIIPVQCANPKCNVISTSDKALQCHGPDRAIKEVPNMTIRRMFFACSEACRPVVQVLVDAESVGPTAKEMGL